jgi:hypothetical protein
MDEIIHMDESIQLLSKKDVNFFLPKMRAIARERNGTGDGKGQVYTKKGPITWVPIMMRYITNSAAGVALLTVFLYTTWPPPLSRR